MRVAIVHYWLVGMRGGERVLEEICRLYPQADIFTHVFDPGAVSETIRAHTVKTTFIARMPFARAQYQKYLGFMPRALEELDLSGYDLIVSSESGPAKGIIPGPLARHVCYCHSPMRYIWDHYHDYARTLNPVARAVFSRVAHRLRQWDVTSAARCDRFIANSAFVAARIGRYWARPADIVHPPVDMEAFAPAPGPHRDYLFVGELVAYKRADLAIEAFRDSGRTLLIAGEGEGRVALERRAPPNVKFLGRVSADRLAALYAQCRALIFPGEEDFGIVPVEAMAAGRPVIALGSGGALDSVKPNVTGLFFNERTPAALRAAIDVFEASPGQFDPARIRGHAETFSAARFRAAFKAIVDEELAAPPRRSCAERGAPQ